MLLELLSLAIVILPLISSIIVGFYGHVLGKIFSIYLSLFLIIATTLCGLLLFYAIGLEHTILDILPYARMDFDYINIKLGFLIDSSTVVMLAIITLISSFVHIYSAEYMNEDPHVVRFFSLLALSTFFMIILVTADNSLQMFIGWEGVGLSSYLLINFWYTRVQANKAAMKAMIVNKIGDICILFALLYIYLFTKSLDYAVVFSLIPFPKCKTIIVLGYKLYLTDMICFLLLIGVVGKSAQLGPHTWLPDAMEGPTPVSALIHAATMVTAGIFLIIRRSPLFEYSPTILHLILLLGGVTAFFAAIIGAAQEDLKKIIAYSTCSQLGYMAYTCGLSHYSLALSHLFNHASSKALPFLCAGSVIHALSDEQDTRRLGGLLRLLPVTYTMFSIASLAPVGFPFMTGLYSKDIIIEIAYSQYRSSGTFIHYPGLLTASVTAYYSTKALYLTFITSSNGFREVNKFSGEGTFQIIAPLTILGLFSIFIGFYARDLFIGFGTDFFDNAIFMRDSSLLFLQSEFIPFWIKNLPVIFTAIGTASYLITRNFIGYYWSLYVKLFYLFSKKWYLDAIYNKIFTQSFLWFGYEITYNPLDKGYIEVLGPKGLSALLLETSKSFRKKHAFKPGDHSLSIALGTVISINYLTFYYANI